MGLLLAVCLLGDAVAMWCLRRSVDQLKTLAEAHRIQSMRAALTADGIRVQMDLFSRLAGHDHTETQRRDNVRRFRASLHRCGTCHHPPELQAEFDAIRRSFEAYQAEAEPLFAGGVESNGPTEQAAIRHADEFVERTTALADRAAMHLAVSSTAAGASIHKAWIVLIVTLVVLLLGGGVVAFHLKARLSKPVETLVEGIKRVGAGDLSFRFPPYADEEFRLLGEAFNRAHEDLENVRDKILQTERLAAVGKLTAGVAHEVLNPLASISSVAQLMRRRSASDEQTKEIDLIMEEIARVSTVLRELLTFSRPEVSEQKTPVDLAAVLDHAVTLVAYDPRARGVDIRPRYDSNLSPVCADRDKLLLVFTNIMLNALDAMTGAQSRSGFLAISAQCHQDTMVVEFEDNGVGMTKEQIAHAFEPFYTTKEPGEGTGLGLWISYQVIQRHNGSIRIDSQAGKGTRFIIELPCGEQKVA